MNLRLKRTASVAAASLVALVAYHLAAVPLIEPAFEDLSGDASSATPFVDQPSRSLAAYLPPGSWELDNPTKIESDRSKLLFKEYRNLPSGNEVELKPCAIVFFPNGESAEAPSQRVIVLEAPLAVLKFDGPVDLQKMKLGQLQGGTMSGPIAIHGTPSRPGANDEIFVDTQGDMQLSPELISTDALVNFRFGPNGGHGRQMRIHLLPSDRPQAKQHSANIGGLRSIELLHDVVMRLVPGTSGIMPLDGPHERPSSKPSVAAAPAASRRLGPPPIPSDDAAPAALREAAAAPPANAPPQPPVDIRCQGPFNFDVARSIATFDDQVDVVRLFPSGLIDHMTSDSLAVFFAVKPSPAAAADAGAHTAKPSTADPSKTTAAGRTSNLEPRRIEARGKPVILRAESNGVYARAEHIDYDIVTRRVMLDDAREIVLQQFANEVHCRSLDYTPGEAGRLGRLEALGPGRLRAFPRQPTPSSTGRSNGQPQTPLVPSAAIGVTQLGLPVAPSHRPQQDAGQFFEAQWTKKLTMRPEGPDHIVSLLGDARAAMTGEGAIAADEIYLWLKELPVVGKPTSERPLSEATSTTPRWQVVADKLLARPNVRIDSPQLSGATALLEAWFEQVAPDNLAARAPNLPFEPGGQSGTGPARQGAPAASPASGQRGPVGPAMTGGAAPQQHFDVVGDRIMVRFLTAPPRTEVQDITIDGHARFGESQTAMPGEIPLLVTGGQIEVLRASAPDTLVTVSGKPAEVAARGLEMYGDVVHLDKGSNRVWIDAPGRMKLPASQPSASPSVAAGRAPSSIMRPAAAPADAMMVTWKDRMVFDGRTAHFEHSVEGDGRSRRFKTDLLDVSLRRRIDFAQPRMEERAEIDRMDFQGGMWMETRTFDPYDPEKLMSIDRMQTVDLSINETTGEIFGHGRGWLTSVRRGSPDPTQQNRPQAAPDPGNRAKASTVAQTGYAPTAKPVGGRHRSSRSGGLRTEKSQLNYLNVQFDGPLSGNLNLHEIVFHDRVRSVYGPVMSWEDQLNPDDVDDLGDGGALMTCDLLKVRQTNDKPPAGAAPDHHPIELEAIGNASVEGEQYRATAARMTYTEAKDLLTLEGDGRRDAWLYRQERPGDPRADTTAKIIYVYFGPAPDGGRSIRQVSESHPTFFELNQLPGKDAAATGSKSADPKASRKGSKQ